MNYSLSLNSGRVLTGGVEALLNGLIKLKQKGSQELSLEDELLQIIKALPLNVKPSHRRLFCSIMSSCINTEEAKQLLQSIKLYDYKTFIHSIGVCVCSLGIALYEGLSKSEMRELGLAAIFHDIGKTSLPTLLLNKTGKFTELERMEMNKHPYFGLAILKDTSFPPYVADVAYEHHEHVDGSGYPRGLSQAEIHPYAKIVAIGDVFDALTSERPYKEAMTIPDALELMEQTAGTQFDSKTMKSFYTFIDEHIRKGVVQ